MTTGITPQTLLCAVVVSLLVGSAVGASVVAWMNTSPTNKDRKENASCGSTPATVSL